MMITQRNRSADLGTPRRTLVRDRSTRKGEWVAVPPLLLTITAVTREVGVTPTARVPSVPARVQVLGSVGVIRARAAGLPDPLHATSA